MAQFKGDLNDDGRITMIDLPLCIKAASGQIIDNGRGDANNDGVTSLTDVPLILKHINGVSLIDGVIY
jgi:hypothetical protein